MKNKPNPNKIKFEATVGGYTEAIKFLKSKDSSFEDYSENIDDMRELLKLANNKYNGNE